jgi:hypothetical protein
MQIKTIILITSLLCALLAIAGCTGTQTSPVVPQGTVAAVTPAVPATSATPDLAVSPTDSIIDANNVVVNVEKDYLANVIVTFQGGNGLKQVNKIEVTLIRTDGLTKTAEVGTTIGSAATLEGTKNADRIIVYVTMKDGKKYKVVDTLIPFKPRV